MEGVAAAAAMAGTNGETSRRAQAEEHFPVIHFRFSIYFSARRRFDSRETRRDIATRTMTFYEVGLVVMKHGYTFTPFLVDLSGSSRVVSSKRVTG